MTKPLLHTQVRDVLDIALPPHRVAQHLQTITPPTMSLRLHDTEADDIPFEITRTNDANHKEICITGILQRWQGTDTCLRFHAVVDVPPPNQQLQQGAVILVLLVLSIVYFRIMGVQSLIESLVLGFNTGYALIGVFGLWIIMLIISGWISYWLIVRDTASERRWHVQQELNSILIRIRALQDSA